jgi:lipopolysaccharide transport system permease protein
MILLAVVFGRLAGIPSDGMPYPLFVLCGLVAWQLFVFSLTNAANSLVANERLLTRVYFPRVLLPVSGVLAGTVDFLLAFTLLGCLLVAYGRVPGAQVLLLPLFVLLDVAIALAVGMTLSALSVRYRDVRHALPFLTQFWFFATPIAYPARLFPERWQLVLGLNPLATVVEGFRWALLGTPAPGAGVIVLSMLVILLAFVGALAYFAHVERTMADEI